MCSSLRLGRGTAGKLRIPELRLLIVFTKPRVMCGNGGESLLRFTPPA